MPPSIESSQRIELQFPNEFDDIKNQKFFSETYKNVVSWYWDKFDRTEIWIIKWVWQNWYQEYKWDISKWRAVILGNRMDKWLFEYRNSEFVNLDKNIIRKIDDANKQRKFREIALKLKKELKTLSTDEVKIIERQFLSAKNANTNPNFDKIFSEIQNLRAVHIQSEQEIADQLHSYTNPLDELSQSIMANNGGWESTLEWVQTGSNFDKLLARIRDKDELDILELNPYLQALKDRVFESDDEIKKRKEDAEILFNDFARYIAIKDYPYETISEEDDEQIFQLVKRYLKSSLNGDENALKKLKHDVFAILNVNDNWIGFRELGKLNFDVVWLMDDIDREIWEKYDKDENLRKQAEFLEKNGILKKEKLIEARIIQDKLAEKLKNEWQLSDEEQELLDRLDMILWENWKWISEFIRLYEIKQLQEEESSVSYSRVGDIHTPEKIEWDMKSINPDAIVTHNNDIRNYVFKDNSNEYYADFDENISLEYRKTLYQKLIKQHEWDQAFKESIKYLDAYGNIDKKKVKEDHIDEESIKRNWKTINKMIDDLAKKEFRDKEKINKINGVCVRKSIMSTCFRALSKYFDKANNNWENFADEFEISDINENIWFDEETWIIKMTGTIKWSNHIWLYYDTKKWELSFDNFIWYNSNEWYILWKNSGEKEKINIKLPTMDEMEKQTDKVNKDLIYNLSFTTPQYIRMLSKRLKESLWMWCFQWFIWTEMDVNRQMVQEFNEKNILKQDIFRSIYSKYYDEDSLNKISNDRLVISEWNSKEQFKLIKLISDSINMCKWSELLRFRNLINKFDKILEENPKLVKKDKLLSVLFGDNKDDENDIYDNSKKTVQQENPNLQTTQRENNISYSWNERYHSNSSSLNYFTFLDLLSDNGVIDLNAFDMALNTIEKEWVQLLDKKEWLLWTNYLLKVALWELPEIDTSKPQTQELITDNTGNIEQEFEWRLQDAYEKA